MAQINAKAGPFQKPGLILLVALLLVVVVFFIPHPVAASAEFLEHPGSGIAELVLPQHHMERLGLVGSAAFERPGWRGWPKYPVWWWRWTPPSPLCWL